MEPMERIRQIHDELLERKDLSEQELITYMEELEKLDGEISLQIQTRH